MKRLTFPTVRIASHMTALCLATLLITTPVAWAQGTQEQGDPGNAGSGDVLSGFDAPMPGDGNAEGDRAPGTGPDLESGFDAPLPGTTSDAEETHPVTKRPRIWKLSGFARLDSTYNYAHHAPQPGQTDYRGLSELRTALQLELSLKLGEKWDAFISGQAFHDFVYTFRGRDHYTQQVLDTYENESEFREVYLRGTPWRNLDVKVGRQIVVWGKSDNIRVVDVLNPLDNRQPGLTDLEDLRLPVTMTRLDYYFGAWSLTGIAVNEVRFSKNPVPGSDYYPPALANQPPEEIPSNGGGNTGWGMALSGIFPGWDLAFYGARFFDDQAHLENVSPGPGVTLRRVHSRLTMVGTATSVALGNWLLKSELARFRGFQFFNVPDREFSRVDLLVGTEYSGITDTTLSVEAVGRRILDYDPRLEAPPDFQPEDSNEYVLTYRGSFLREKLDLVAVLAFFGQHAEAGNVQRYSASYELAEALDLTGGVVTYAAGDGSNLLLENARNNDRLFLQLKWSF